ncbi:MAG: adenylyltransferase/cytidyltransferase family protein [Candidatus Aenigmarchaeota archaeon]|nr:adenylyltransferase/cytidyltransferase family protein [Candidatus Aenigmarchaeota archaeon]
MIKVLCGGRFNFLHSGHEYFLKKAKDHGDYLVVVIAHDAHNLKREEKKEMEQRKKQIESLGIADTVLIGDPEDFFKVVVKEKPQVIALGWDQRLPFAEDKTKQFGIKIVRIEKAKI